MRKLLEDVVPGREHKIVLLEVANEAWQNGFPGDAGVSDLREFAAYLGGRTEIPVAISSNHESGDSKGFERLYCRPSVGPGDLAFQPGPPHRRRVEAGLRLLGARRSARVPARQQQ